MSTNNNALGVNVALATFNRNTEGLTNKELIKVTNDIFKATEAIDKSYGALAYAMHKAQILIGQNGLDGYKNFAEYAEKRIGVKRAQAFNIAKAGSMLKEIRTAKNGKEYRFLIDKYTMQKCNLEDIKKNPDTVYDYEDIAKIKCFSNTALIRISQYCDSKHPEIEENIINLIKDGRIFPDMSVAKIVNTIDKAEKARLTVNTTATETATETATAKPNTKTPEKTVTITMSYDDIISLKLQLIDITSKDLKNPKVSEIVKFIENVNEILKK